MKAEGRTGAGLPGALREVSAGARPSRNRLPHLLTKAGVQSSRSWMAHVSPDASRRMSCARRACSCRMVREPARRFSSRRSGGAGTMRSPRMCQATS